MSLGQPRPQEVEPGAPVDRWLTMVVAPLVALVVGAVAAGTTVMVARIQGGVGAPLVFRLEVVAWVVLAVGVVLGVEWLVATAAVPALAGAVLTVLAAPQVPWVEPLVIGCLWYLGVEVALGSIEWRDGIPRSGGAIWVPVNRLAQVMAATGLTGLTVVVLGSVAPDRTLVARGGAMALMVAALIWARRWLHRSDFREDQQGTSCNNDVEGGTNS